MECPREKGAPKIPGLETAWVTREKILGDSWKEEWGEQPKFCSYCGGINPQDALRLVFAGWELEKAIGKDYKYYMHPPGYGEFHERFCEFIKHPALERGEAAKDWPEFDQPSIPIKLYTYHLSEEERQRINHMLESGS